MPRAEFTKAIKLRAFTACNGRCAGCGIKLVTGDIEYHHDKECTFGGKNEIENCIVLCKRCHSSITRSKAAVVAKSNRQRAKHLGIKKKGRKIPGSKGSGFRRKLDGTVWKE